MPFTASQFKRLSNQFVVKAEEKNISTPQRRNIKDLIMINICASTSQ